MTFDDLVKHVDHARSLVDHPAAVALCDAIDEYFARSPDSGKIYFVRAGEDGPVKIGFTHGAPSDRIAALQTGCPYPIVYLGAIWGTQVEERQLHRRFINHWISGEWFAPHAEVLLHIYDVVLNPMSMNTVADLDAYRRQVRAEKREGK